MTPAETLTAAATRLREAANLHDDPGPWTVHQANGFLRVGPDTPSGKAWRPLIGADLPEEKRPTAEYIALVHPGVGLALADWLDDAAKRQRAAEESAYRVWAKAGTDVDEAADRDRWIASQVNQQALAVARALLGEVTE